MEGLRGEKNMRWNAPGLSYSRPIRWIVALLGTEVVPFSVAGMTAGRKTAVHRSAPWIAFLPALDSTTMGWKQRLWYLGDHGRFGNSLFDSNGNAGPTVWVDGRIVGGWAQRRMGDVVYELLEDVGREATAAITEAAGALEDWLGDVRVTPRFPTPLHKTLSVINRPPRRRRVVTSSSTRG